MLALLNPHSMAAPALCSAQGEIWSLYGLIGQELQPHVQSFFVGLPLVRRPFNCILTGEGKCWGRRKICTRTSWMYGCRPYGDRLRKLV